MRTAMHTFGAMLIIAGIIACAPTQTPDSLMEQGHEPLTTSELRAIYGDGTTYHWNTYKYSGTTEYMPDGSAALDSGSLQTEGSWHITDGQLCNQFADIRDGDERCFTAFRIDDQYKFFHDNELSHWGSFE